MRFNLFIMKTISKLATLFILLALVVVSSCVSIKGDMNVIKKERKITSAFTAVKVSTGIDVYLTQSTNTSVVVEADENLHEILKTKVEDGILKIYFSEHVGERAKSIVYVSMSEISALKTSSGAYIESQTNLDVDTLEISTSSGSTIVIDVTAKQIDCDASSGGSITLNGKTNKLLAEASSGSKINANKLKAQDVKAEVSSGAEIEVYAEKSINAEASSGGSINCQGTPQKTNIKKSSGGDIDIQ